MKLKRLLFTSLAVALSSAAFGKFFSAQNQVQAACCYFAAKEKDIDQPGQKAFISWKPGDRIESFTVQPKFEGNAVDFGMVIPTPSRPKLDEMPRDFFKDLAMYTILMPLPQPIYTPLDRMKFKAVGRMALMEGDERKDGPARHVTVLESGVVGSLDYKIIVADDSQALFEWLKEHQYVFSGDEATLAHYIKKKWFFTVMKIDPKQMKKAANGSYNGEVTPTRFSFSTNKCIYPLKITQISVKDKTDALFYVQAPRQMDLESEMSWMPSYRSMYLTYMLGCGANQEQQQELQACNSRISDIRKKDPRFETTKLEWAKQLGSSDLAVLEDPKRNYGQSAVGDLPPGAKAIPLENFLARVRAEYLKTNKQMPPYAEQSLTSMSDMYQPAKGTIVEFDDKSIGQGYLYTHFAFYPARVAPYEEIKGLTRLKGHLQKNQWLTKFRRVIRKDEMTHDLVLVEVPKEKEQTYVRIMPTSPP